MMRISDVLPVPFGPSTAINSPRCELEVQALPEQALAEAQPQTDGRDDGCGGRSPGERRFERARLAELPLTGRSRRGGSVSLTPTTGMPARAAAARMRVVIGDTAWVL